LDGKGIVTAPTFEKDDIRPIEALFVREFRALQALLALTRDEQAALLGPDIPRLLMLAERKETLLDRLAELEGLRQSRLADLAHLPLDDEDEEGPELGRRARLERLSEGIEALSGQTRELARRNRALADRALQQASQMQAGLMTSTQESLPALFAAILDGREALEAQDHAGVEAAVGDLQKALRPAETPAASLARTNGGLVETMASLHRQEKAYRAVLRLSTRLIAAV
jgi:flagellar biosynthesis/type III secretory pathway chaperone